MTRIKDFTPDGRNANKGTARGQKMIVSSIQEDGFGRSVLADKNGVLIAGNKTLEASAEVFGVDSEPIVVESDGTRPVVVKRLDLDLSDPDPNNPARRLAYRDNLTSHFSFSLDPAIVMADIETGFNFEAIDISLPDLGEMLEGAARELLNGNGNDAEPQIDKAKELQVKWSTALGQVWEMPSQVDGRPHRVVCGDCTDRAVVEAVMRGERANQLVTDPPYNMGSETGLFAQDAPTHYRSTSKLAESNWDYNFDLSLFFENALSVLAEDTTAYVFTSHFLINDIWAWMKDWTKFYSYCVWCKPNPSPSLAKRHWTWGTELVAYGVRGNHTFNYPDGTHALNWWDITTPRHTTEHPTEKPLSVIQRPIEFSSRVGDVVCDFFLGSGTTLIAAHNLHRIARGIEIDPGYIGVVLERYYQAFGIEPRLVGSHISH